MLRLCIMLHYKFDCLDLYSLQLNTQGYRTWGALAEYLHGRGSRATG